MISTRGRYAIRVMIDVAEHNNGSFIPLNEIAERQGVSIKYLEIVLKSLVQGRLLEGKRGKGGGYRLTRTPEEYNVGEIVEMAEGKITIVACLAEGAPPCPRAASCPTVKMWSDLQNLIHDFFYNISLSQLMRDGVDSLPTFQGVETCALPSSRFNAAGK